MTPTCALIAAHLVRLRLVDSVPPDLRIIRTRAGHWQKSAGAWSWDLWSDSDIHNHAVGIGSSWRAKEIAHCRRVLWSNSAGMIHLDLCPDCEKGRPEPAPPQAQVIDLMEALKASLAKRKGPEPAPPEVGCPHDPPCPDCGPAPPEVKP